LLVGVHEDGRLRYAGRVGTGFTEATLRQLNAALAPLARTDCPFDPPPRLPRSPGVHWVEPQRVAQVEFAEWTDEGLLRQASFQGLRDDKPARAIVREGRPGATTSTRTRPGPRTSVAGPAAAAALDPARPRPHPRPPTSAASPIRSG
jgi:bifunctional non-homologous end joining protein LigD